MLRHAEAIEALRWIVGAVESGIAVLVKVIRQRGKCTVGRMFESHECVGRIFVGHVGGNGHQQFGIVNDGEGVLCTECLDTVIEVESEFSAADRKSTRLNSSHQIISYAVFCLKKKK